MPAVITLFDLLEATTRKRPAAVFVEHGQQQLTYEAFRLEALRAAQALEAHGVRAGDRVGVYMEKSIDTLVATFGASAAGGVFVVMHPSAKAAQLTHMVRDSGMKVVVVSAQTLKQLGDDAREIFTGVTVLVAGPAATSASWATSFDAARRTAQPLASTVARTGRDVAALLYTSGSTGLPKAVIIPHQTIVEGGFIVSSYLELDEHDRLYGILPLSFDYGFNQITSTIAVGATVVLGEYLLVSELLRNLRALRITNLAATPVIWTSIAKYFSERPGETFPPLRRGTNSGGAIPERAVRQLVDILGDTRLYLMYGLTEAFRSTFLPPDQVRRRPTSMGKPVPGVEIHLITDDGREAAPGEPGELVHRGAFVNLGYYNRPDATEKVYRKLPWQVPGVPLEETVVYSGDLVRRDEEGFLYFLERRNSIIKSRGFRISPEEVERHVNEVEGVVVSAVASRSNGAGDEDIIAFVVARAEAERSALELRLRASIRASLPAHMQPHEVVFLSALPANGNNKIDRQRLKEMAADHAKSDAPSSASSAAATAEVVHA